eukprot:ctg_177.g77
MAPTCAGGRASTVAGFLVGFPQLDAAVSQRGGADDAGGTGAAGFGTASEADDAGGRAAQDGGSGGARLQALLLRSRRGRGKAVALSDHIRAGVGEHDRSGAGVQRRGATGVYAERGIRISGWARGRRQTVASDAAVYVRGHPGG